jgi:hypothetical protein
MRQRSSTKRRIPKAPKEREETVTFGEVFDNANEGGRGGETVVDAVLQVGVKGSEVLPKWGWNLEVTQAQKEKFTKN